MPATVVSARHDVEHAVHVLPFDVRQHAVSVDVDANLAPDLDETDRPAVWSKVTGFAEESRDFHSAFSGPLAHPTLIRTSVPQPVMSVLIRESPMSESKSSRRPGDRADSRLRTARWR